MIKIFVILFNIIVLLPVQGAFAEQSRPMGEMHGGCANYKMDLAREFKIWNEPVEKIPFSFKKEIPWAKKIELELKNQSEVNLVLKPEKSFRDENESYAGVFKLKSRESLHLIVGAGSKVWFDVIDQVTMKPLAAVEFEMQTGCEKVFKAVKFTIDKNRGYLLQVSSSKTPRQEFVITDE